MIIQEKCFDTALDYQGIQWRSYLTKDLLHELLRRVTLFPLLHLFTSPKVMGAENIAGNGPYVFVANHSSHLDAPLILWALPYRLRLQLRVAAAADYFFTRSWLATLVTMLLNAYPMTRKGAGCADSLAGSAQLLRQGYSLLLFPEGTRSVDGRLQPFKSGVARLALTERVSVVPVWIEGAHAALPKGAKWPRPHRVVLHFGLPMYCDSSDTLSTVIAEIERQVRALAPNPQEI
jgi:1-acyl-sn-glycerol-3-phosphate acyltransferase